MAKRINPEAGKVQLIWEGVLKWTTFGLGCLHMVLSLLRYYDGDIRESFLKIEKWAVILLAIAVISYVLYTKFKAPRLMFRIQNFTKGLFRPELKILTVLFFWYVLCVLSANEVYTANFWQLNDTMLFDTLMSFFFLFIFGYLFHGDAGKKMLEILFYVLTAVLTVLMVYVLWTVLKPSVITLPSGGQIGMGEHEGTTRLFINCHPNTTGAIAEIVLMMCVYMIVTKKGILRWLYVAAAAVHYAILILSDSRTCILTTALTLGILIFKFCINVLEEKKKLQVQRVVLVALAGIACGAVVFLLRKPMRLGYEGISHFSEYTGINSASTLRDLEATTNGRVLWWKASFQSAFSDIRHFFFGVTPVGVISEVKRFTGYEFYTHNQFCEILVSNGVPGMLMYLAWLVLIARTCIRMLRGKVNGVFKGIEVILGMIFMLVIANLMEATLLYYHWFPEEIFFLLCGFVTYRECNLG